MINPFKSSLRALKSATFAIGLVPLATASLAEEVTLHTHDGQLTLTGDFIAFENNTYVIQSSYGPLRIGGDLVTCSGPGCPATQISAGEPVVWDVSLWGSRRAFTEHVERLSELVAERTDGLFQINISYGGLAEARENLDGIAAGDFEMAQFCAGYHPDKNPAITVLELPFLGVSSLEQEIDLSLAVYAHSATQADMARWNAILLMPSPLPQYNIVGTGLPPTSLADFGKLKVRATGGIGDAVASLGAELVPIPAPAVRDAMESGEVNAVSFAPHAHMSFGTVERATWWTTNLNPGTVNCPVVVNSYAMERLPDMYRIALISSVPDALDHYVAHYNGATMDAWGPALKENGVMELTINSAILASINEAVAAPAAANWIAENALKGLPARELYDLVVRKVSSWN